MSDTTNTPVNLDINTLVNILKIVDFAFNDGAFKGIDVVRSVLQERDRLAAFIDSLPTHNNEPTTSMVTDPPAPVATKAASKAPVKKIKRK